MPRKKKEVPTVKVTAQAGVPRFAGKIFTVDVSVELAQKGGEALCEFLRQAFATHLEKFIGITGVSYTLPKPEDEDDG